MGIIEHIEMTQFMCHKFLTFSLGPQINFIIGKSLYLVAAAVSDYTLPGHNGSEYRTVILALTT